jgi:hypothetical protein
VVVGEKKLKIEMKNMAVGCVGGKSEVDPY